MTETTGNVGTDLFQRDPLTIWDEALGSVGPGELEEGAFGGAIQNHGAVVLDGLGQVGLDSHLRNRFCSQRQEEPQRSFNHPDVLRRSAVFLIVYISKQTAAAAEQPKDVGGAWSGPAGPGPVPRKPSSKTNIQRLNEAGREPAAHRPAGLVLRVPQRKEGRVLTL